ncbi:isoflavone reductase [Colletotrichum karsti]|uniref:Isoflavone reductase n=1 Tax=Colletotrichum karsti TaxID=1095194 RepID=A0A9P6I4H1_9PEZI|nr:isoflavone reductase [Colletotrichum karsti]KAF9875675.1 isoflavone reductase [Colletotrichum karsti]
MTRTTVAIAGATGETGRSIIEALLDDAENFEVTALARPASANNQKHEALRARGVKVVAADLAGPEEALVAALSGIDVVIAPLSVPSLRDQIPLARAAKKAGVKRFVPSEFAMAMPPRGIHDAQDVKTDVLDEIKRLHLPYTVINVGWWYAGFIPRLPSGRTAPHVLTAYITGDNLIPGDGEAVCAVVDTRDIGRYVARIIRDPRTLNKCVLASGFAHRMNELYDLAEEMSGEKIERTYVSAEDMERRIQDYRRAIAEGETDFKVTVNLLMMQYFLAAGVRQENSPEYAEYLGYLLATDLYPDFNPITFREAFQEILDGKARPAYS